MHDVSPEPVPTFRRHASMRDARYVGRGPSAALLAVGPERDDLVGRAFHRGAVAIGMSPRIAGNHAPLEVGPVPHLAVARPRHERAEAFARARIAADVEIIQIERAREALDLNLGRLGLRLAEIVQHARADEAHDQADDGDHDQNFHEREAGRAAQRGGGLAPDPGEAFVHGGKPLVDQPTTWLTDISAVITETIRPPTTRLMATMAAGPAIPTTRSS